MRLVFLAALCVLSACVSAPRIVSLESGAFLVTGVATIRDGGVEGARGKALQLATQHCSSLGMRTEVKEITSSEPTQYGHGATDVEFICVPDA